tara:strand:- start:3434 stop:4585 length:1152 start_codon:yes stop_codon:yes gene_type:complete
VINLITQISVVGISAITASLIILLSAFNGIEVMIEKLYSEYDSDITIRAKIGKTFNENRININSLLDVNGIDQITKSIEEDVILKHQNKWSNASLIGVEKSFLKMSKMKHHMVDGSPYLNIEGQYCSLIGASLLDKLNGYIPQEDGYESLVCYYPKRNLKIRLGKQPFKAEVIKVAGRFNFNRQVNQESFIVPLDLARKMMDYANHISAIYINCSMNKSQIKKDVANIVGDEFIVKTNYEKNELIYKTSKSEKIIVLIILLFIFILAAFNLVASLNMLFVEKLQNIKTMISLGASRKFIFKIFFYEGLLISGKGIIIGSILGYFICFLQMHFELINMPSSGGQAFPINVSFFDSVLILSLVSVLSIVFSYIPVKYLIKKNIRS